MTTTRRQRGIILFAHGSRDPLWHKPMESVAARVGKIEPHAQVRCAYLELTAPDLPACAAALIANGVKSITIVPMFLGVGRHAREDLPVLVAGLRSTYPEVAIQLQPSIGEDDRLLDLLANIALS